MSMIFPLEKGEGGGERSTHARCEGGKEMVKKERSNSSTSLFFRRRIKRKRKGGLTPGRYRRGEQPKDLRLLLPE